MNPIPNLVQDQFVVQYEATIDELEDDLDATTYMLGETKNDLESLRNQYATSQAERQQSHATIIQLRTHINTLEDDLANTTRTLEDDLANTTRTLGDTVAVLTTNLETLRQQFETSQAERQQSRVRIPQLRAKIDRLEAELTTAKATNRHTVAPFHSEASTRTLLSHFTVAAAQDRGGAFSEGRLALIKAIGAIVRRRNEFDMQRDILRRIITRGREVLREDVNIEVLWEIMWLAEALK